MSVVYTRTDDERARRGEMSRRYEMWSDAYNQHEDKCDDCHLALATECECRGRAEDWDELPELDPGEELPF